jgi:5-methylcytosine-specific restriction enzyme A
MSDPLAIGLPPSPVQYAEALAAIRPQMQDMDVALLRALHGFGNRGGTAAALATATAIKGGWPRVNIRIGTLGHLLCQELDLHPSTRRNGTFRWWTALATGRWAEHGFRWTMRHEVSEALERLGWASCNHVPLTEEIAPGDRFVEGAVVRVLVNAHERDPRARAACVRVHGARCAVCGSDFGSVYGDIASGFIHVHHLKPLADIDSEYSVDPAIDLRPVCPNCHAVIHLGGKCRSIEEVQEMLLANRAGPAGAAARECVAAGAGLLPRGRPTGPGGG